MPATTGRSPGWREVGSLRIASTPARMEELRRQHGWAKTFGLPWSCSARTECGALFPPMVLDGVLGGVYWLPTDGHVDPSGLTLRVRSARHGTRASRSRRAYASSQASPSFAGAARRRRHRPRTGRGREQSSSPAACTRLSSLSVAGVDIPIVPMAHQYVITEPIDGVTRRPPAAA